MFAPPHPRHEQDYSVATASAQDSYSFVPAPPPPSLPLNALSYQQQQHQFAYGEPQHTEHRRSISLPQTPAATAQLHHPLPQHQQHYFVDDLSPSSSALPNIARGQAQQQQQQQLYVMPSPAGMPTELPMSHGMHILPPTVPKRARGERISSKDFVPPDVTGLSKREARLVKNRAAAFLSRQRKREEFEAMEYRVNELEAQNSRLMAQLSSGVQNMAPSEAHQMHVAALQARINALEHELATLHSSRSPSPSSSQGSSYRQNSVDSVTGTPSTNSQVIGMGLMALLSLSSMSPPTTKFCFTPPSGAGHGAEEPTPVTATPFNYESIARWQARLAAQSPAVPEEPAAAAAEFDIAFSQTEDNRIRCHVSVPQQQLYSTTPEYTSEPLPLSHPGSASSYHTTFADAGAWPQQQGQAPPPAPPQAPTMQLGPTRRVRVALRGQSVGNSSGEWEVEVC